MVEHAENACNFLSFSKKGISAQFWYKKSVPVAKCVSYSTTYCGKLTKVFFSSLVNACDALTRAAFLAHLLVTGRLDVSSSYQ